MPIDKPKSTKPVTAHNPGKPVSLKFLAEHLGLSRATISLVLNDSPVAKGIPQVTRERILKAAKKFNYRPNYFARYLNKKRSYLVGVMVPELGDGYDAGILAGVERQLVADKYFYFIASHQWVPSMIEETPRMLADRGAEGILFINTPLAHPPAVPAVNIGGRESVEAVSNMVIDNRHAVRLALEHLVNLGHRSIAFFKGHAGSADTEERWDGILKAAAEFGIEVQPELVIQLDRSQLPSGFNPPDEGYVFASRLLERRRNFNFTALFAFNDVSAIGALRAFREAGIRVPEDVSLVGFDDVEAAAIVHPALTTIRQPLRYMGELAAKTLLRRIETGDRKPEQIMVQPELIIRESTCPAK